MKKMYFLLVLLCISLQSLYSVEFDKSKLPKLLGSSNMGREFYFSFIPCWEDVPHSDLKIYISSNVRTKVVVEVPDKGNQNIKYTVPNDIIEFTLSPAIGQPYTKIHTQPPEPDKVYYGSGVHVIADDPIICNGVTRYPYTSDGFLALPVNSLGKEYIIASFADISDNDGQWLPSEFTVISAYDKTKVLFTMGGTDWSKTVSGQQPGQTTPWNLNKGDVLMVSSLGHKAELSGSIISADKPVAVVSGNFCAYVPTNCGCCDFLMEMELPTDTWGMTYHVTPIANRLKNSLIKIFAKEPKTNIYRDGNLMGFIKNAGGVSGYGYLDMRADEGIVRPVVISGDKPISVTQYNTSQLDDSIESDPFQMVLVPTEQYQNEITFNTPGIRGGFGFPNNYINLCYEPTDSNTIPDDMEFAEVVGGQFVWKSLKELTANPGDSFSIVNNKKYFSKLITLPGDGVYKIRANKPFQAYSYGFSSYDSYGFPASVSLKKLDIIDTLLPEPEWNMDCRGNVNWGKVGWVTDKPDDPENRANLSTIILHSDKSYNYELYYADFMPCYDEKTIWRLETIDPGEDAIAVVSFTDCSGNDTTLVIEYESRKLSTEPELIQFENAKIANNYNQQIILKNITETREYYLDNIMLLNGKTDFIIYDSKMNPIMLPFKMFPNDSILLNIQFKPEIDGLSRDTLIITDSCVIYKKIPIIGYTEGTSVESEIINSVLVYPNPTEDILIIDKLPMNTSKIQIFDEQGKEIRTIDIKNQSESMKISTKDLPVGVYVLRMFVGSEVVDRKFGVLR